MAEHPLGMVGKHAFNLYGGISTMPKQQFERVFAPCSRNRIDLTSRELC
jgi:hypothetical protein